MSLYIGKPLVRVRALWQAAARETVLKKGPFVRVAASVLSLALLSACVSTANLDRLTPERDPYEKFNRSMWNVNQALDKVALKPVSSLYRAVTPKPARRGITRVFANLEEPWSFVNNLLQGKPKRALRNLGRFVVNSTVGVGGLADQASKIGIKNSPEDFGETLAAWGVKSGPYLVLPLLGPSTLRDAVGSGVAYFADPWHICLDKCTDLTWGEKFGIGAFQVVTMRSDATEAGADAFLESSLDPYAAARSAWFQSRRAAIRNDDGLGATPTGGGASDGMDATGDAALDAAVADLKENADGGNAATETEEKKAAPGAAPTPAPAPQPPETTPDTAPDTPPAPQPEAPPGPR